MVMFQRASLNLQWSITALCDQRCRHCYMYDSPTYASELKHPLDLPHCRMVIDDLVQTSRRWGMTSSITFTGGDPLLRHDFSDILDYAYHSDVHTGILGNPYHVDPPTARALKSAGVSFYQISIDGMRDIHDGWRKPGSFDDSVRALQVLKEEGITTLVMFTLSRLNADQLVQVLRLAAELEVDIFHFDRLVCEGQASGLADEMLSPAEMRTLLHEFHHAEVELRDAGHRIVTFYKIPLWKLYAAEEGALDRALLAEADAKEQIIGGCYIGGPWLSVLADGTVYPCRRLPLPIGKLPQDSIGQILVQSPLLQAFRDLSSWEKCHACELRTTCRGCAAVAYAATGSPFGPDPQCWHILPEREVTR